MLDGNNGFDLTAPPRAPPNNPGCTGGTRTPNATSYARCGVHRQAKSYSDKANMANETDGAAGKEVRRR